MTDVDHGTGSAEITAYPRIPGLPDLVEDSGWAYCDWCGVGWRYPKLPSQVMAREWWNHLREHRKSLDEAGVYLPL